MTYLLFVIVIYLKWLNGLVLSERDPWLALVFCVFVFGGCWNWSQEKGVRQYDSSLDGLWESSLLTLAMIPSSTSSSTRISLWKGSSTSQNQSAAPSLQNAFIFTVWWHFHFFFFFYRMLAQVPVQVYSILGVASTSCSLLLSTSVYTKLTLSISFYKYEI